MNFKVILQHVYETQRKNDPGERHMGFIRTTFGIVWNHILYGTSISDFYLFHFYEKTRKEKLTFLTEGDWRYLRNYVNDMKYLYLFENKAAFDKQYAKYIKRDYFHLKDNREDYLKFVENTLASGGSLIYKPIDGSQGHGVFVLDAGDPHLTDWDWLTAHDNDMIVEKVLKNHHAIRALNPDSLNTIRIPVLLKDGEYQIIGAFLRIGRKGKVVDNFGSGGVYCEIDLDTGRIKSPAIDKRGVYYQKHPDSGITFMDYEIPFMEESKKLVMDAVQSNPVLKYYAWDIAILEDGPVLIEGGYCGQIGFQSPSNKGRRPLFEEYLPKRHLYFGYRKYAIPENYARDV